MFRSKLDEITARKLIVVLEEVIRYLESSTDSIWSDMSVEEARKLLFNSVQQLRETRKIRLSRLYGAFLPTAALQEISIENNWAEEFLELSGRFDRCIIRYY